MTGKWAPPIAQKLGFTLEEPWHLGGGLWSVEQQVESPGERGFEGLGEEQHGPRRCKGATSGEELARVGRLEASGRRKGDVEYNWRWRSGSGC